MPDITMCQDSDCPMSWNCWRFNAPPSYYQQSYFLESPRKKAKFYGMDWEDSDCDYYWPQYDDTALAD